MKKPSLIDLLTKKFMDKGGITERQAKELAKTAAPAVRKAIKAEEEAKSIRKKKEIPSLPPEVSSEPVGPVAQPGQVIPVEGIAGADLMATMDGRSTPSGYTVAAVKGPIGIVAVRHFNHENVNKVKFYPNLEYWGITIEDLSAMGNNSFVCNRGIYQRFIMNDSTLSNLLAHINELAQESPQTTRLSGRLKTASIRVLMHKFHSSPEEE